MSVFNTQLLNGFKDKEIKAAACGEPHDIMSVAKDTNLGGHFWLLHVLRCILLHLVGLIHSHNLTSPDKNTEPSVNLN